MTFWNDARELANIKLGYILDIAWNLSEMDYWKTKNVGLNLSLSKAAFPLLGRTVSIPVIFPLKPGTGSTIRKRSRPIILSMAELC